MKYFLPLIFLLIVGCGPAPDARPGTQPEADNSKNEFIEDGCVINTTSNLVNQHSVGPIRNLVKDKQEDGVNGRCTVSFDITVDGKLYHLTEEEEGLEQLESLCYYARERARKNLLLDLGGEFKTESTVACKQQDRSH